MQKASGHNQLPRRVFGTESLTQATKSMTHLISNLFIRGVGLLESIRAKAFHGYFNLIALSLQASTHFMQ